MTERQQRTAEVFLTLLNLRAEMGLPAPEEPLQLFAWAGSLEAKEWADWREADSEERGRLIDAHNDKLNEEADDAWRWARAFNYGVL